MASPLFTRCMRQFAMPTCLLLFAFMTLASANEAVTRSALKAPVATEPLADGALISRWIADLESPSQATRGAAQTELQRAGDAALEQITAAVRSANPEVRLRSIEILRRHASGEEPALVERAKETLAGLATDADMGVARAAESAIAANARKRAAEEAADMSQQRMLVRGGGAMIRLRPAIAAREVAVPGAVRSVSIAVINGKRTISAKDGDEQVEISDGGEDGIKMSITKKVDGKEKTEKFAAKDADELKTKHAEAFKVYEQYAKDGGGAVIKEFRARARVALPEAEGSGKDKPAPKLPPVNHTDVPKVAPVPAPMR